MTAVLLFSAAFIVCLLGADRLVAIAVALHRAHLCGVERVRRYDAVRAQRALLHRPSGRRAPRSSMRSQPVSRPVPPQAGRAPVPSVGA